MPALFAALLVTAALGRTAEIERLPTAPLEPIAPLASAASPEVSSLQAWLDKPSPIPALAGINAFGTPGPGLEAAHVVAMQALADELKAPVFAARKGAALDLGVIADVETFARLGADKARFLNMPDVHEAPALRRDSIVEAVLEGRFVVAPSRRAQGFFTEEETAARLRSLAAPWRTERQLSRLEGAPRSPEDALKFAVIGDAEPGRFRVWRWLFNEAGVFERQLAGADRRGADFIMQLGDMVSRGTKTNFTRFFETLARLAPRTPYLTLIGNHDRHKPHGVTNDDEYRSAFGKTNYFFDRGGYRFVALDSSAGRVTHEQLEWLDDTLATPLKTVVFTHMMPAAIRDRSGSGGAFAMGGFKAGSEEFARIVARREVQRVYVGHIHALGVRDYLGVRYVLTGGGGSPLFPLVSPRYAFHHYLTVEAGPNGLVETVHTPDGRTRPLR